MANPPPTASLRSRAKLRRAFYDAIKKDFEEYGINMYSNYPRFLGMVQDAMTRVMKRKPRNG